MTIPVTIIGGFLGSGKTTLLNRVLANPRGTKFAVIVNDFGAINIDEQLIASHDGQTISLANGCVCCTIGDNFIRTLLQIVGGQPQPDHIVIEASGVADPVRIAEIALIDKDLRLDGVVVLADAANLLDQTADLRLTDTIERQIDSADLVLLNKTDLVDADRKEACWRWIRERRSKLPIYDVVGANVPVELLFGIDANQHDQRAGHNHHHELPFETQSMTSGQSIPKDPLIAYLSDRSPGVLRAKGIIQISDTTWETLQKVGERIEWSPAVRPQDGKSQLVLIGLSPLSSLDWTAELGFVQT